MAHGAPEPPAGGGTLQDGPPEAGTLFVVATPIGNLGDVTLRALETLAPGAAHRGRGHPDRAAPAGALRDRDAARELPRAERPGAARPSSWSTSDGGADLALVTDAGTPAVSDPGGELVAAWAAEGGRVVPIPGASAVLAAVAASGLAGPRWGFEGFLPRAGRERRERLARIGADDRATVLFEAPTRLAATLRDLAAACGADRPAAVCRELTKLHEQVVRGTLAELEQAVRDGSIPARGEVVLVIAGAGPWAGDAAGRASTGDVDAARVRVAALVAGGMRSADAARQVAAETGLPRRGLYQPRARD